ncbi:MAG: 16S rRNA (cytidine(1402)-2'-O)-methyltransferase [Candidatus Woykebacteria bacterium RBG_13_40_15]|uniref:Ribosomal RNA small subunit methyltransferase I n=1 Tax=Candidatus Woykebacteria bacterium RBG_13_40_15 TaxID=1802593 RepID=A0A1G1W775_9BACT|nr:MAG: 16S rRNA (cytidine(1402)-2'-O)-methyltransferase [Candidatus Woykebacteria bacterium RBG_13_40_15]
MGTLFLVATPIGNLSDISKRAIETLEKVDLVACEDTRRTGLLLQQLGLKKNLISYYEENELKQIPNIVNELKAGKNVALVTDSGTPSVSDPGFRLVRKAVANGINVDSIPGPSAVLTALTISSLPTNQFFFFGFPPPKEGKRKELFSKIKEMQKISKFTAIFFESPYKLITNLTNLQEIFGDIDIVICRELTKVYQEVRREKVSQSLEHFSKQKPKGEFTILFYN